MAEAKTYAMFCTARAVSGVFSAWSQTVPASTIADIFPKEVRGSKMSMYVVGIVIGPAVAPIFSGLIVQHAAWPNLFWFILGLAGLQLILFAMLVPETMWHQDDTLPAASDAMPCNDGKMQTMHVEDGNKHEDLHIEDVASEHDRGHVGPAWMPWAQPLEYIQISIGPILMVSLPYH